MHTQTKQGPLAGPSDTDARLARGSTLEPAAGPTQEPAGGRGCTLAAPVPTTVGQAGHLGTGPLSSGSAATSVALPARVVRRRAGLARRSGRWLVGFTATPSRRTGQLWARITHFLAGLLAWLSAVHGVWRIRAADQRGSQITDNLGLVVIGIVAIIAIGGLISGLDKTVFNWVTTQLGLSSGGSAG
jgi:hypothetical protein